MSKAIFLDRDGTLNKEVNYLRRIEDIKILPGVKEALIKFRQSGFLNIIITNQSGIARGYLTENDLKNIHSEFRKLLRNESEDLIDEIYYSPYHTDGIIEKYSIQSKDRKPETGMILKARERFNIDLKESYFIGDSFTDMQCAENAGLKKILVKTGYGETDYEKCRESDIKIDYYADDLSDAAMFVEKYHNQKIK